MIYITDSRGNKSVTLTFVLLSWCVATWQMLSGGASLAEYAGAIGAMLGVWVGREYVRKE